MTIFSLEEVDLMFIWGDSLTFYLYIKKIADFLFIMAVYNRQEWVQLWR